jgi:hypothetical protein
MYKKTLANDTETMDRDAGKYTKENPMTEEDGKSRPSTKGL